jgi:hypothetical protein
LTTSIYAPGAREVHVVKLVSGPALPEKDHEYNEPGLSATEFLTRVMHDQTVSLTLRAEAANHLLRLQPPPRPAPVVTVKIEGGMRAEPTDPDLLAQYPLLRLVN